MALLMLSCGTMFAEQDSIPSRKKVGVVLSGGGAKGMAHIGVLKVAMHQLNTTLALSMKRVLAPA